MSKDLIIQNTAIVADDYNQLIDGVKKGETLSHILYIISVLGYSSVKAPLKGTSI